MPQARRHQISLSATPYYHCMSRCVRRAYLCGKDSYSGQSYEHRRGWVEQRLLQLSRAFAIDICAYAVMSNHLHVVLHVDVAQAATWSVTEVLERWHRLHRGTCLTQNFRKGVPLTGTQLQTVEQTANVYRQRLSDISWFMRELNEHIARQANREDDCSGRFWEGRFKSQALLDEKALIACMAYVDLNPIRAGIATSLATSSYTSIARRLRAARGSGQSPDLMDMAPDSAAGLSLTLADYQALLTMSMPSSTASKARQTQAQTNQLTQLGLSARQWHTLSRQFEALFYQAAGSPARMASYAQQTGRQFIKGCGVAKTYFSTSLRENWHFPANR